MAQSRSWVPVTVLVLGLLYLLGRMIANAIGVIAVDLEVELNPRPTQTAALAGAPILLAAWRRFRGACCFHAPVPASS